MQTLCLVYIMLTQLQNAERVSSVWDVYMNQSLKDDNENDFQVFSHREIKIPVIYQSLSCLPSPLLSNHGPSLLKLANCSARLLYVLITK